MGKRSENILKRLKIANEQANPEIFRIAFKLATGAGKTTVMAMLIAWQSERGPSPTDKIIFPSIFDCSPWHHN